MFVWQLKGNGVAMEQEGLNFSDKCSSDLVSTMQKTLSKSVVILTEVKCLSGISRTTRAEIEQLVNEINLMSVNLPELAKKPGFITVFSELIEKLRSLGRKVFGG